MIPFKRKIGFQTIYANEVGYQSIYIERCHEWLCLSFSNVHWKKYQGTPTVGLCSRVVLDLMSGLNTQGNQLFTDNYYTSPEFYHTLYKLGINACGTVEAVRTNRRSFPKELIHFKREQFERGYYDYRSCGPLLASFSLAGQPLH